MRRTRGDAAASPGRRECNGRHWRSPPHQPVLRTRPVSGLTRWRRKRSDTGRKRLPTRTDERAVAVAYAAGSDDFRRGAITVAGAVRDFHPFPEHLGLDGRGFCLAVPGKSNAGRAHRDRHAKRRNLSEREEHACQCRAHQVGERASGHSLETQPGDIAASTGRHHAETAHQDGN